MTIHGIHTTLRAACSGTLLLGVLVIAGCGSRPDGAQAHDPEVSAFQIVKATPRPPRRTVQDTYPADAATSWTTLASGVRFHDLVPGRGLRLTSGSVACFHIKTFLGDGTFFHSTMNERKPVCFVFCGGRMPAALEEALQGMCERGRRLVEFPGGMNYASDCHLADGPFLPPGAEARFELSLLFVEPQRTHAAPLAAAGSFGKGEEVASSR